MVPCDCSPPRQQGVPGGVLSLAPDRQQGATSRAVKRAEAYVSQCEAHDVAGVASFRVVYGVGDDGLVIDAGAVTA